MATQTAKPTAATLIPSVQEYRDRFRNIPDHVIGSVTDAASANLGVVDGGGGSTVNIANGQALIQGTLYEISAGPLSLSTGVIPASDRTDIVVVTYDPTHSPIAYAQILPGTPGAGFPIMRSNPQGIFDLALAHYVKHSDGSITLVDRRMFGNNHGKILGKDAFAGSGFGSDFIQGWFPSPERIGHEVTFWPSLNTWIWEGASWGIRDGVFHATGQTTRNNTTDYILAPGLAVPVAANCRYSFDCFLHYSSVTDPVDVKIAWTFPVGTTMQYSSGGLYSTATATPGNQDWGDISQVYSVTLGTIGGTTQVTARTNGVIKTGSEPGVVNLWWSQRNATAETTTLYADSYLRARKILT